LQSNVVLAILVMVVRTVYRRGKERIVATSERFEFRISERERARLRELAAQTSRTESGVVRFLIQQAGVPVNGGIVPLSVPPMARCVEEKAAAA